MSSSLLFLALLPGIVIIIFIFRKDRVEHEPISLILKLVLFGGISCLPAMYLEGIVSGWGTAFEDNAYTGAVFEAFCVAAICEELCKYVLLRLGSWNNRNFDFRFDGIVYAVSVAVGFALLENVLYVAAGGISVAITRGLLAVPLHSFCGVFMGIFYGAAKKHSVMGETGKSIRAKLGAVIIPIMIHGIYDSLAMIGQLWATILLLAFVAFMYIIAIRNVNRYSREDWRAGFYTEPLSTGGDRY